MFGLEYKQMQRGVKLLDREMPGWEQFIDTDKLDLARAERCILGQLYSGNYQMGEAVLFGRGRTDSQAERLSTKHGFNGGWLTGNNKLTREWNRLINIRQYDSTNIERACPAKAKATRTIEV